MNTTPYQKGQHTALEKVGAPLGLLTKLLGKITPYTSGLKQLGAKGMSAYGKLGPGSQAAMKQMGVGAAAGSVPGMIAGGSGEDGSLLGALGGGLLGAGAGAAGGRLLGKRMQAALPRNIRSGFAGQAFPRGYQI